MSTIYNGKSTAWLQIEIDKVLSDILPPRVTYHEGVSGTYEVKHLNEKHVEARTKLIRISRQYAQKERATPPTEVSGEVDHGFSD